MAKGRRKECYYSKKNFNPDYKDVTTLGRFITPWGKIKSAKDTGNCAKHQRRLGEAIKQARFLALMPYTTR